MEAIRNWSFVILLTLSFGGLLSCDNDEVELIDAHYKKLEVSCGSDFEIPVLAGDWNIEYVKDVSTGMELSDKDGNPLALNGIGKVEAANGWLTLSRAGKEAFVVGLKENFIKDHERNLLICINSAGKRDHVTIVQRAGSYQLVKSEFEEIEDRRDIYWSDKGCKNIVLTNPLPTEVWAHIDRIFEDVVETTIFESDDYEAFAWIPDEGVIVAVPDLMIDNYIRWTGSRCQYKEGSISVPRYMEDIPDGDMVLMPPHSTFYISAEILYCKRVGKYTFTIQNKDSGIRFEVKGRWTHIVPIEQHTTLSDKGRK